MGGGVSINSKKIEITVLLENKLYDAFHSKSVEQGSTHIGIIRMLIQNWVENSCWHSNTTTHPASNVSVRKRA